MNHSFDRFNRRVRNFLLGCFLLGGLVLGILFVPGHVVVALPEYAVRTGESCATCHVSAGGGGPRTLRGLLWAARGKPDKVPVLPGALIAPRVSDPVELYQIACGGCHGMKGEGASAMRITGTRINTEAVRGFLIKGIPKRGMPAFEKQLSPDQMDSLSVYVAGLSKGEIPPPANSYPLLHPAVILCDQAAGNPTCLHPAVENGGN